MSTIFELKEEHIKLLTKSYVSWNDMETGAASIDCKRPYGSSGSDVLVEMAEIVFGMKFDRNDGRDIFDILTQEQQDYLWKLHKETETALEIVLRNKTFELGLYTYDRQWIPVKEQSEEIQVTEIKRERKSWDEYFLDIADVVATRGTCDRKHVGSVIVKNKNIVSTGYNGSIHGMGHCDEEGHLLNDEGRCVRTLHALCSVSSVHDSVYAC